MSLCLPIRSADPPVPMLYSISVRGDDAFGVTPHNQSVFVGNAWIVKATGALQVLLDPASRRCFVDQGPLVYGAKNG